MQRKKITSITGGVLNAEPRVKQPWLTLLVMIGIPLDVIRMLLHFVLTMVAILCVSIMIFSGIIYLKVKPEYDNYMGEAAEIVDASSKESFRYNEVTVLYDNSGKKMDMLSKDSETIYLSYNEIPPDVINAFVAVENRTFWEDPGVDWKSLARVVYDAVRTRGKEVHGASTITQQLARTVFLNNGVTLDRKLKEMAIAVKLTEKYSKQEIMEFYVNNIYFANGYYGIEAASQGYFGKTTEELSLSEIAYLCAIPNSPVFFDPYNDPARAIERRDHILDSMYEVGFISLERAEKAKEEEIKIKDKAGADGDYDVTYAVDCAIRYLMYLDGFSFQYRFDTEDDMKNYDSSFTNEYEKMREELYQGGYRIYTSIDSEKQRMLQSKVDEFIDKHRTQDLPDLEAAVVLVDEKGNINAVIGGTSDGAAFGFNRAYQAYRQPGSTIKPLIVYLPALMQGMLPDMNVKNINVKEALAKEKERMLHGISYEISELDGKDVTMRYALEHSLNGAAYYLFDKVGVADAMFPLHKMEFSKISIADYTLSASLGGLTYGVTPIEMAGAYACIANEGLFNQPTCIVSIKDRYGKELYHEKESIQIYDGLSCNRLKDMMEGVMIRGTAASLKWYESTKAKAYVKTGTTNDQKDVWMCGWTEKNDDKAVMSVWIGCDMPKTGKNADLWGGSTAGSLWKDCMLAVIEPEKK